MNKFFGTGSPRLTWNKGHEMGILLLLKGHKCINYPLHNTAITLQNNTGTDILYMIYQISVNMHHNIIKVFAQHMTITFRNKFWFR